MSFAAVVERLRTLENPFPGLRAFGTADAAAFFGRSQQVAELLVRLERNQFLAVVGVSGSGKSSLVRAGLLPALARGRPAESQQWRVVVMTPGSAPIERLAAALKHAGLDPAGLTASSYGLINVAQQLPSSERMLLVVDQFEELFRYKDLATVSARDGRDLAAAEAAEFVRLLLVSSQHHPPVHVVITMRSDYLGDCAEYRDLPETLNDCQYLVPRLTRAQRKEAIEGPLGRVAIASSLVQRLLNDAGDDPDQLPVLQHALRRTWNRWRRDDPGETRPIELQDYLAIGRLDGALNQHADELLAEVPIEIAATVFKRLTAGGRAGREHRDPATLAELWAVCGAGTQEQRAQVSLVVDRFRSGEATFLMPSGDVLGPDEYVDITHESLIRQWHRLRDEWVLEEQESAKTFLDLIERARSWRSGTGETLAGLDLTRAIDWDRRRNKTDAWATSYGRLDDLRLVEEFVAASRSAERTRRWKDRGFWIATPLLLIFAGLAAVAAYSSVRAVQAARQAQQAQLQAEGAQKEADGERLKALDAKRAAEDERAKALLERSAAESARDEAEDQRRIAQRESAAAAASGTLALSRQLLAQAAMLRTEQVDLEMPALLAIEAVLRVPGLDGDRALRETAARLPREIARVRHATGVRALAFGGNGQFVVAGIAKARAWFAELDHATAPVELTAGTSPILVALSSDGNWLATSGGNVVTLFAAGSRLPVASFTLPQAAVAIAISSNGELVAVSSWNRVVRVFDRTSGKEIWSQEHQDAVNALAIDAGKRIVVTGSGDRTGVAASSSKPTQDNTARVFDLASGKELSRLTVLAPVRDIALSVDARWVAIGSDDNTARVFEAGTGRELSRQTHRSPVTAVAISPDGRWVASGSGLTAEFGASFFKPDNTVRVFEREGGREVARVTHQEAVTDVAFSADGRQVASTGEDFVTRVFEATATAAAGGLRLVHENAIQGMALSEDGRRFASGTGQTRGGLSSALNALYAGLGRNGARVFELSTGTLLLHPIEKTPVRAVAISRDGLHLAVGADDNTARVINLATGTQRQTARFLGPVTAVALSADSRYFAAGDRLGFVRVYEVETMRDSGGPEHRGREVTALSFGSSSNRLAMAADTLVQVADLSLGNIVKIGFGETIGAVAFSHSGRWVGTRQGVFDAVSGAKVADFTVPAAEAIAFSTDDRRVAVGGRDGAARVFDTGTGRELVRIETGGPVGAMRFAGRSLVTASAIRDSAVVSSHLLQADDLIAEVCDRLTRSLSPAEWRQFVGNQVSYRKTCPNRP